MLVLATTLLGVASPVWVDEVNLAKAMTELSDAVEASEKTPTPALLLATEACEALLSRPETIVAKGSGWTLRYEFEHGSVFARDGVYIMHVLGEEDFPESCGVIAMPSEGYSLVKQSFSQKYGPLVTPNHVADNGRLYPTSTITGPVYSYRLRSADNPKSALTITVRHKE